MSNFSFVAESANAQTPEQTLLVLVYEVGALIEHLTSKDALSLDAALVEMSDVISMTRMFCEQTGTPPPESDGLPYPCPTMPDICNIVVARLGRLVRCFHYDCVYGIGKHVHGTLAGRVSELVDVEVTLCRTIGFGFYKLAELGQQRYTDRMNDMRKYGTGRNASGQ